MKFKILFTVILSGIKMILCAQDNPGFQLPPEEIITIVYAPQTPALLASPDNTTNLMLERTELPSIADLSKPEIACRYKVQCCEQRTKPQPGWLSAVTLTGLS
jgi:hypothetical protein